MKVACIQLSSGENYNKNFKDIIKYINQAIKNKADLIITPETSSLMSADKNNLFKYSYEMKNDPIIKKVKLIAKKRRNGYLLAQCVLKKKAN